MGLHGLCRSTDELTRILPDPKALKMAWWRESIAVLLGSEALSSVCITMKHVMLTTMLCLALLETLMWSLHAYQSLGVSRSPRCHFGAVEGRKWVSSVSSAGSCGGRGYGGWRQRVRRYQDLGRHGHRSSLAAFINEENSTPVDAVARMDGDIIDPEEILFATDILGDVNFCLRSTDSALSGQSRSKLLNSITNFVFKAIIIGSNSGVEYVNSIFDDFRIKVGQ